MKAVDVHCHAGATPADHGEISAWIEGQVSDDVETIVVGERIVAVHGHGTFAGMTGTAVRRAGRLADDLDEALARMRAAKQI